MPMIPRLSIATFAAALSLTALVAQADTPVSYTEKGKALFSFDAPDFWTVHVGGPRDLSDPKVNQSRSVSRLIGLQPATESKIWVGFISPAGVTDFADAKEYLSEIGPFLVKNAEIEKRTEKVIGGRPARTVSGSGNRDGKAVNFTAIAIDLPHNRMAISVVVMEAGFGQDNLAGVNRMFASFRVGG